MKILTIKSIKVMDNFMIDITLSNGKNYLFDLKEYFKFPFIKKMQELSYFKRVKFRGELLYWDDMHDFPLHCMDIPQDILD
jgi:hypothetical protein